MAMAGVNKAILIGNLGADPEVKQLESGSKLSTFSLATNESYRDKQSGERRTITDWHRIVAFDQLAELVEKYLSKGRQVYVEGRIKTRSFEDKDGNPRKIVEIRADTITFLGGRDSAASGESETPDYAASTGAGASSPEVSQQPASGSYEDDLPF